MMKTTLCFLIGILLFSCGSSDVSETSGNLDSSKLEAALDSNSIFSSGFLYQYILQLETFESEIEAIRFIEENQDSINYQLISIYDDYKKVFSVQLPVFNSRIKAEEMIAELSKIENFINAVMIIRKVDVDY